jgi:predicted NodU family carbamoyl transferase
MATTSGSRASCTGPTRWACSYSAFTYYLGFKVNSGEYKVMGLAPYGEPKYVKQILDAVVESQGRRLAG